MKFGFLVTSESGICAPMFFVNDDEAVALDAARAFVMKHDKYPLMKTRPTGPHFFESTGEPTNEPTFVYDYAIREESARYPGERNYSETWGSQQNWQIRKTMVAA